MEKMIKRKDILFLTKGILELSPGREEIWADYDEEADVLYLSFRRPQKANDSVMEDDIVYHYDDGDLVGVTVLNARRNVGGSEDEGE